MIYVFINQNQLNKSTSNEVLDALIEYVRKFTGQDYQLIEREFKNKNKYFWSKKIKKYQLLIKSCVGDYEVLKCNSSGNNWYESELVISYLHGIIAGAELNVRNKSR